MRRVLAMTLVVAASCGRCGRARIDVPQLDEDAQTAPVRRDAGLGTGTVRAYPPHAIRADGVGPYLLGEDLKQVLRELPEGPHLELLQVGHYANWRVARAEGDAIVIGADAENVVAFISVLTPEVGRTSSGVGVGATGAELRAALGTPLATPQRVRDRRIFEFESLPTVHFLTAQPVDAPPDEARVVGVIVARRDEPADERRAGCAGGPAATPEEIVAAARKAGVPAAAGTPRIAGGCFTGGAPEAAVLGGGELVLVGGEPGKLRRMAVVPAADSPLFGALDVSDDGREEIVLARQVAGDAEHFVDLRVLRWEGGRLVEVLADRPFAVRAGAAAFAGVAPADIDLALEARVVHGELQLGGWFTTRRGAGMRGLAPLSPVALKLEPRRATAVAEKPGARDAGGRDAPRESE